MGFGFRGFGSGLKVHCPGFEPTLEAHILESEEVKG
jgi:hypothetical protein